MRIKENIFPPNKMPEAFDGIRQFVI